MRCGRLPLRDARQLRRADPAGEGPNVASVRARKHAAIVLAFTF